MNKTTNDAKYVQLPEAVSCLPKEELTSNIPLASQAWPKQKDWTKHETFLNHLVVIFHCVIVSSLSGQTHRLKCYRRAHMALLAYTVLVSTNIDTWHWSELRREAHNEYSILHTDVIC